MLTSVNPLAWCPRDLDDLFDTPLTEPVISMLSRSALPEVEIHATKPTPAATVIETPGFRSPSCDLYPEHLLDRFSVQNTDLPEYTDDPVVVPEWYCGDYPEWYHRSSENAITQRDGVQGCLRRIYKAPRLCRALCVGVRDLFCF